MDKQPRSAEQKIAYIHLNSESVYQPPLRCVPNDKELLRRLREAKGDLLCD